MVIEFFMPMLPPTITHQQHKVKTVNGKPVFYDPPELKDARQKLTANLIPNIPEQPFTTAVRLTTKWLFPKGQHKNGEWKTTKPDTDNMIKLLKDCMGILQRTYAQQRWNSWSSMVDSVDCTPHREICCCIEARDLAGTMELLRKDIDGNSEEN